MTNSVEMKETIPLRGVGGEVEKVVQGSTFTSLQGREGVKLTNVSEDSDGSGIV